MAVSVKIPTQLRSLTGGDAEVQATGATVSDLIEDLASSFPGIKERLIGDDGALRRFVNLYVDQEDVRFLDGIHTKVSEESKVSIIPAVAGG
jgi:molybdopterin converting factor small subunit